MTTVRDITQWLEKLAPGALAESWDNVGLLVGDPDSVLDRVMTCLTVTPSTAAEAIRESAGMIVSHHPVLFRGTKLLRADRPETASLWSLARAGIAIASPHTAFDSAEQGINAMICLRLGLIDVKPLRPIAGTHFGPPSPDHSSTRYKVVVFTPELERDAVLSAAFGAGGGRIGDYQECSFAIPGDGTFFGTEATNPSVGSRGRRETVRELRLEVVCTADVLPRVLTAVRASHSYEEPAIDVYPLHEPTGTRMAASEGAIAGGTPARASGAGRVGRFVEPRRLDEFAMLAGRILGRVPVQVAGEPNRVVTRVAVACGAGDDFLDDAVKTGADVLLTGEARFHRALEAEAHGIGLVVAGHHATERIGVEELAVLISKSFPELTVWPSQDEHDPLRWLDPKGG